MEFSIEQKKARHKRFFEPFEKGEGAYLAVTSPIDDSGKLPFRLPPPKNLHEQWISAEYAVLREEERAQNTYWGLDALQSAFVNFGPGVQAALLGAPYELTPECIWFDLYPPIKNWDTIPVFKTDPEHELYKAIEDKTRALLAASKGRYTVSVTDIGGQMDVLFSLRGEELLTDLIDYPDEVKTAQNQLDTEWIEYFNKMTNMIGPSGFGYTTWAPIVWDKPWYPIQCDMSVMISPRMFEEFVLPSLDKVSAAAGRAIYHLDGPEEVKHLDMLLSLKHVSCIQWTPLPDPVPGRVGFDQDFADELSLGVYKRALEAGKKVAIFHAPAVQIEKIFDAVGCDGVYIVTSLNTRKDADEFIENAIRKKWVAL